MSKFKPKSLVFSDNMWMEVNLSAQSSYVLEVRTLGTYLCAKCCELRAGHRALGFGKQTPSPCVDNN
jgi:hypothetical protein